MSTFTLFFQEFPYPLVEKLPYLTGNSPLPLVEFFPCCYRCCTSLSFPRKRESIFLFCRFCSLYACPVKLCFTGVIPAPTVIYTCGSWRECKLRLIYLLLPFLYFLVFVLPPEGFPSPAPSYPGIQGSSLRTTGFSGFLLAGFSFLSKTTFLGASTVVGTCLLIRYCCPIPKRVEVNQYRVKPEGRLKLIKPIIKGIIIVIIFCLFSRSSVFTGTSSGGHLLL